MNVRALGMRAGVVARDPVAAGLDTEEGSPELPSGRLRRRWMWLAVAVGPA